MTDPGSEGRTGGDGRTGEGLPGRWPAPVRAAAENLSDAAMARVMDQRGVRVEDYLTVLASLTGEAVLVASGVLDIESSDLTPGAPVFGDPMNALLSGDQLDPAAAPPGSVVGVLVGALVPDVVPLEAFADLRGPYQRVAAGVGSAAWGSVVTSVPEANRPTVLPIQVAFELRPNVDEAAARAGLPRDRRHEVCALALALGIRLARDAIDPRVAVTLALDVSFGMAKMVPMSRRAFATMTSPE